MVSPSRKSPVTRLHSSRFLHLGGSRKEFLEYFQNGWALTEMLFSGLAFEAAYYIRPYHKLRHPMIFYYGHPVALYVNKLRLAGLLNTAVDTRLEQLFETGVDEMRWDQLHETDDVWPSLEEVRAYRNKVYDIICNLILTHPALEKGHAPVTQESPLWALVMGFEHERIHLETSSVLIRELPLEYVRMPQQWPASACRPFDTFTPQAGREYKAHDMRMISARQVTLGKPSDYPSFGWDNEYGNETRHVDGFRAGNALISNGEFHAFVADGGYSDSSYWTQEGWEWRGFRNTKWPAFWISDGPAGLHHYKLRTCFEAVPMQWDWPVCVNYHEAKAYCAWKSIRDKAAIPYRLLTEAEHHALREESADDPVMRQDAAQLPYNLNFAHGSESSVQAYPANGKGFHDVFGNVWQWLEDHFHPLPGHKVHPYYTDFSEPCYDGEHRMMLGGSFASTGDEASMFARFQFRPHFFQHAGFRLAQSIDGPPGGSPKHILRKNTSAYDTESMLNAYMLMHWGAQDDIYDDEVFRAINRPDVVELPVATAALARAHAGCFERALDLGCAVGRAAFEMARDFRQVVGVDYSQAFIAAGKTLQHRGTLGYYRSNNGENGVHLTARVPCDIDRERVTFMQGDACLLPEDIGAFDAVLLANLLCRLRDPALCLSRLGGGNALVKPGGIVVITTPLSWLEHYTPRDKWLPDIKAIQAMLGGFTLVETRPLPFMIREHRRKFEYIVTEASVWRREN